MGGINYTCIVYLITVRNLSSSYQHIEMATNNQAKPTKPAKGGVSPVWDCVILDPENDSYVYCNKITCRQRISRGKDRAHYSTTSILKHLAWCIPIEFAKAKKNKV